MDKLPKLEINVALVAILVSAFHLGLIAFAAFELGITVPDCEDDANFNSAEFIAHGPKHYEVKINAKMWSFEPNYIKLPVGSQLDIFMRSQDVVHGMFISGTNVNLMAVPGAIASASHTFMKPGRYPIICHEYCGVGHQGMSGLIEVVDELEEAVVAGLPANSPELAGGDDMMSSPAADIDQELVNLVTEKGCIGCHSLDGTKLPGPTFKGLWGREETLESGETITVDEAYIRESIAEPAAKVTKGFPPVMPPYQLTDEEIENIIALLKAIQ